MSSQYLASAGIPINCNDYYVSHGSMQCRYLGVMQRLLLTLLEIFYLFVVSIL